MNTQAEPLHEPLALERVPFLQLTATRAHLRHVFLVRNAVLGAALVYAGARWVAAIPVAVTDWSVAVFLLAVLVNVGTWARLRDPLPVSHNEFLLQILADVALLAAAMHHTGGEMSPLLVLYLVPLTIAAATLPFPHTVAVFAAVVLAHEVVCVLLPAGAFHALAEVERKSDLVDLLAAGLIAYFVATMARATREHERLLSSIHEEYLRQRHSADLGTLAAYAAHQIASPLATISVLVNDLRSGRWRPKDLRKALDLMANEIETCKSVSSRLLANAGHMRAEGGGRVPADRFLAAIVDKCQLMHPWIAVSWRHEGGTPPPEIVAEASLEQAILALLKRNPGPTRRVEVSQSWDGEYLRILICHCCADGDAGGDDPYLGDHNLLMATHAVSRFGGALERLEHSSGRCVRVSLPLDTVGVSGGLSRMDGLA